MSPATKVFSLAILAAVIFTTNSRIIMNEDPSENEVTSSLHTELKRFGRKLHGPEDQAVGELLKSYNPTEHKVNPEELGSYVEGDLLFPHREGRNGLSDMSTRWSKGIIPYEISGSFSGNELALIQQAMQAYHAKTCIRFKQRASEKDYIVITNSNSGCWSSVGRIGGRQEVNLQTPGCMTKVGTAIHELMHAVGFLHEQNRFERDNFVRIAFQNIKPGVESNFDKASEKSTNAFGVGYDYGSIMHYSANAFSTNGQPTIVALKSGGSQMGQRNGFSQADINKINAMYLCRPGNGGATGAGSVLPARPANGGFLGLVGSLFGLHDGNSTETHDGDSNNQNGGQQMGQRNGFSESDIAKINRMYLCQRPQGNLGALPGGFNPGLPTGGQFPPGPGFAGGSVPGPYYPNRPFLPGGPPPPPPPFYPGGSGPFPIPFYPKDEQNE